MKSSRSKSEWRGTGEEGYDRKQMDKMTKSSLVTPYSSPEKETMSPNPFLKKLGYSETDRLVIIHTDDIGMCHASVQAFRDLWGFGTITSAAVMVPCPWFPFVAQMCRENPAIDMGGHATLNSEWEN